MENRLKYESHHKRPFDESVESRYAKDTENEGHGSHTASTATGFVVVNASLFHYTQGEAKRMANKARITAYKICRQLGCFNYNILVVMNEVVADGVHMISLFVGATGYAPQYYRDSITEVGNVYRITGCC